jgi:hypothetical protein
VDQGCCRPGFGQECRGRLVRSVITGRSEYLDGTGAFQSEVVSPINTGHSAGSKEFVNPVVAEFLPDQFVIVLQVHGSREIGCRIEIAQMKRGTLAQIVSAMRAAQLGRILEGSIARWAICADNRHDKSLANSDAWRKPRLAIWAAGNSPPSRIRVLWNGTSKRRKAIAAKFSYLEQHDHVRV